MAHFVLMCRQETTHSLFVDWLKVGYVSNRETKFTVAGLAEGASYFFRVFAENRSGLSRPLQSDCVTPTQPLGTSYSASSSTHSVSE